jgi:arginase
MDVQLIAVPYDSGRRAERMGAGPEHLLRAGLESRLSEAGHSVRVLVLEAPVDSWRAEIQTAFDLARAVAAAVTQALAAGTFPMVLSGNCGPAALGCVSALGHQPAVFWFDAHGDFNTPETTIGGFLDGMALATVTGRCWPQLAGAIPRFHAVPESSIALIGARDLDPLEARALDGSGVRRIARAALRRDLPAALDSLGANTAAYLHLDLDVLDPSEGRINAYAAPDGLSRVDVEWAIAAIAGSMALEAAALTAYDPASDVTGTGCEAALALGVALVSAAARWRDS